MYSTEKLLGVLPNISVVRAELAIYKAMELRQEVCNLYNIPFVTAPSMIVVDSGAGIHLTDATNVVQLEQAEPFKLHTANGKIVSSTVARNNSGEFFGDVEFRVTKKTPTVLSLGRLIRFKQMRFHWDENGPVLLTKEGIPVPLTVINDVPFYEFPKMEHRIC